MITRRIARPSGLLKAFSSQPSSPWTCPSCVRHTPNGISTSTPAPTRAVSIPQRLQQRRPLSCTPRRRVHSVPSNSYHQTFSKNGVAGLFSDEGYKLAWTLPQEMYIRRLNELVAGEPIEHLSVKELAHIFARDPMNAALFNHASMCFNNHFFFDSFSPQPLEITKVPQLRDSLIRTFGSIETLRATMLDTADSMFGPGFVWLVWARDGGGKMTTSRGGSWRILSTYLAGTPYPESGYRQQGVDMNNNTLDTYQAYLAEQASIPGNTAGAFGPHSVQGRARAKIPPGGTTLEPVLCVSTWEHIYLYDYGVESRRKYLSNWWKAVDWGMVTERAPQDSKQGPGFSGAGLSG